MYEPESEYLQRIKDRISPQSWNRRVAEARKLEKVVKAIVRRIDGGESQDSAIRAETKPSQRTKMLRLLKRYGEDGFEGLFDRRTPRERKATAEERNVIETARLIDPNVSVERIQQVLEKKFGEAASEATIKRVLAEGGLERPVGRPPKADGVQVEELGAGGLELIRAAEAETGAVGDLVEAVVDVAGQLPEPGELDDKDRAFRNKRGQFTGGYNRARRKKSGQVVAEAYRTAEEKAETMDLGRLAFRTQSRQTIEAKLWALLSTPVLTFGNRLDELYGPRGKFLEGICGYAYMPETLRKMVSELTVAGAGYVMQQVSAWTWHRVSVERWNRGYRALVVYVDTMAKPLWTQMFVKSAKVSSTGRVQPALVSTFIHTGAGSPIYFEAHSGTAPLAPRVLKLLERVEREAEYPVGRLTVIDGEGCSARLLREFKVAGRDLVTPLPSTLAVPERIEFGKGSAPQPYREGDTIREGRITLLDSHDRSMRVEARAIVIEHRTKAGWSALVSLADRDEWPARVLADVYFDRWPKQENFFKLANEAVKLDKVHGYGKRMVANTTVLTRIDELERKAERAEEQALATEQQLDELADRRPEVNNDHSRIERYVAKRQERVDEGIERDKTYTAVFVRAASELRESGERLRELDKELGELDKAEQELSSQKEKLEHRARKARAELDKLEERKEILEADVAQDTLFTTLKITLAMMIHFVVVEYFKHRPMTWRTFLSRLALLPGRRETTETTITTFIEANDRDLELMEALEKACQRINRRRLIYNERRLRYVVEWPESKRGPSG